jgi:hypothetical protein
MKLTGENRSARGKTYPTATLSTTNPTWTDPGSNPGLRGDRPATNRLSHGTALCALTDSQFYGSTMLLMLWSISRPGRFASRYPMDSRLGAPKSRSQSCEEEKHVWPYQEYRSQLLSSPAPSLVITNKRVIPASAIYCSIIRKIEIHVQETFGKKHIWELLLLTRASYCTLQPMLL